MTKEELETMTISEINGILSANGFTKDCVYPLQEINNIYSSAFELASNISSESNLHKSSFFRKNAYGHFIGYDTEIEAKNYVIEIAKDLV